MVPIFFAKATLNIWNQDPFRTSFKASRCRLSGVFVSTSGQVISNKKRKVWIFLKKMTNWSKVSSESQRAVVSLTTFLNCFKNTRLVCWQQVRKRSLITQGEQRLNKYGYDSWPNGGNMTDSSWFGPLPAVMFQTAIRWSAFQLWSARLIFFPTWIYLRAQLDWLGLHRLSSCWIHCPS